MTNKLAENIRAFRKARSLTQEQLAEVLGVTTGAVYKLSLIHIFSPAPTQHQLTARRRWTLSSSKMRPA